MSCIRQNGVLVLCLWWWTTHQATGSADFQIVLGDEKFSLDYADRKLADGGGVELTGAFFLPKDGKVYAGNLEVKSRAADARRRSISQIYQWGTIGVTFNPEGSRLGIVVDVGVDEAADTLVGLSVQLMALQLDGKPKGKSNSFYFFGGPTTMAHNVGGLGTVTVADGAASMIFYIEDMERPLAFGLGVPTGKDNGFLCPVLMYTGRHPMLMNKWPFIARPIAPGAKDTFKASIRVAPAGTDAGSLTADLARSFAETYPYKCKWQDRRPIGRIIMCSSAMGCAGNPRGWFNDRQLDISSKEGLAKFGARIFAYASNAVTICKDMNAQGVIVWDIEGQEFPHPVSYIGDPRALPDIAPEMDAVADEFFMKFRAAGLLTGITIRPSRIARAAYATPTSGKVGAALACDGSGAYFEVPHSPALEPERLTLEAWIRPAEMPAEGDRRRWIVNKNGNEWADGHYALVAADDRVMACLNIGGGQNNYNTVTSPKRSLRVDTWHHLAMTYDGVLRLYLDGMLVGSTPINKPRKAGKSALSIGRRQDGYNYFAGAIDEVRVYGRVLSPEEIKAHCESASGVPDVKAEDGLAGYWGFDDLKARSSSPGKGRWQHVDVKDPTAEMSDKIAYAKKRWGCRLFYMDSNIRWRDDPFVIPGAQGYSATVEPLEKLSADHPDVLILPEWEDLRTYSLAAPYSSLSVDGLTSPQSYVLRAYPQAFLVNLPFGKKSEDTINSLRAAVRRGDIMLFDGWWNNPENEDVKKLY